MDTGAVWISRPNWSICSRIPELIHSGRAFNSEPSTSTWGSMLWFLKHFSHHKLVNYC
jgi:hypothetical protein